MVSIITDAGHGGKDPGGGGSTKGYFTEKEKTLQISLYQDRRYKELGLTSYLSRKVDLYLPSKERVKVVNSFSANLCVSNHTNACGADGAEVIRSLNDHSGLAEIIAEEIELAGQNVRRVFTKSLPKDPNKDYYYMIRKINCQSVIVEYGFGDSPKDDQEQLKDNWIDLAESVVKAVCRFYAIPYTPPFDQIPEWKLEGIKALSAAGLLDYDQWIGKLDKPLPAWAEFNVISRLLNK